MSEIILPQSRKSYLEKRFKYITSPKGNTDSFNYVVSSDEYKCMMMDLYKQYDIVVPIKLIVKCSL